MTDPAVKYYAALFFDELEEYEEFISEASRLLGAGKNKSVLVNNRGLAYLEIGRNLEAEHDLRASCASDQSAIMPMLNLANALEEQGKTKEALQVVTSAISRHPANAQGYFSRAKLHRQSQQSQAAEKDEAHARKLLAT